MGNPKGSSPGPVQKTMLASTSPHFSLISELFSGMCGISGIWERHGCSQQDLKRRVSAMTQTLSHRGPDDSGVWLDPGASIAFGQRRLAIVDLSPMGHQPMISANGQYAITFNGEIYNFRELRAELETRGVRFRGH